MKDSPVFVINNSKESKTAKKYLDKNDVNYTILYSRNSYATMPTIISEGASYKGIKGIKTFVGIRIAK